MPPFAAGVFPADPNIPPPGPVANIGAPKTLDPAPEAEDPKALKSETTLRGGEAGVAPLNSGDWGVGGAPGTPRRGGSLPPGV